MLPLNDLVRWLFDGPSQLPSGPWLSWISEDHSGYPYPEATAIALRTADWWHKVNGQDVLGVSRTAAMQYLEQSVGPDGLVRREGIGYLFDTLLVLAALDGASPGRYRESRVADRMTIAVVNNLESRTAVSGTLPRRWSHRFGPHLLKALSIASLYPRWKAPHGSIFNSSIEYLTEMQGRDGQLVHPDDEGIYLHAHCYALEGLAIFDRHGVPECRIPFLDGLSLLTDQQLPGGGFPQWTQSVGAPHAADVTAQAGRLLLLPESQCDERTLLAIDNSLHECLTGGGIRYLSNSSDENTWCTAFVLQYAYGRKFGLEPDQWV